MTAKLFVSTQPSVAELMSRDEAHNRAFLSTDDLSPSSESVYVVALRLMFQIHMQYRNMSPNNNVSHSQPTGGTGDPIQIINPVNRDVGMQLRKLAQLCGKNLDSKRYMIRVTGNAIAAQIEWFRGAAPLLMRWQPTRFR